jgi:hypothetical protein
LITAINDRDAPEHLTHLEYHYINRLSITDIVHSPASFCLGLLLVIPSKSGEGAVGGERRMLALQRRYIGDSFHTFELLPAYVSSAKPIFRARENLEEAIQSLGRNCLSFLKRGTEENI